MSMPIDSIGEIVIERFAIVQEVFFQPRVLIEQLRFPRRRVVLVVDQRVDQLQPNRIGVK